MGAGEIGVEPDGPREMVGGDRIVGRIEAVHVAESEVIEAPGVEGLRRPQPRAFGLVEGDVQFHRRGHEVDDIRPHLVNVIDPARPAIAPDDATVARVGEFDRQGEIGPEDFHLAGQAVGRAERRAHGVHVGRLVRNRKVDPRATTFNQRRRDSDEISSDGTASAMARVGLGLTDLAEGQHRDRRLPADLRRRVNGVRDPRREFCADFGRNDHLHRANKAKATAVHGADQALRLAVIVQGPARRLDQRRDRRVGDEPAVPDVFRPVRPW